VVGRELQVSVDGDEVHVAGDLAPGVVLSRLGHHLARVEAVDRSRMPLQELISRLMRGGAPPRPAPSPPEPQRPVNGGSPPTAWPPAPSPTPSVEPAPGRGTPSWRGASWRPGPPGTAEGPVNGTTNGAVNGANHGSAGYGWPPNGSSANGASGNGTNGNGSRPW